MHYASKIFFIYESCISSRDAFARKVHIRHFRCSCSLRTHCTIKTPLFVKDASVIGILLSAKDISDTLGALVYEGHIIC